MNNWLFGLLHSFLGSTFSFSENEMVLDNNSDVIDLMDLYEGLQILI